MKIILRPHLKIRLKERKIPQSYPSKILTKPDNRFFYVETNHLIAAIKKPIYNKKTNVLWLMVKGGPEEEHKEIATLDASKTFRS